MLIAARRLEFYRVMRSQLIPRLNSSVSTYKVLLNCHGSMANIAMNNIIGVYTCTLLKLAELRSQICANLISQLYNNIIALVVVFKS